MNAIKVGSNLQLAITRQKSVQKKRDEICGVCCRISRNSERSVSMPFKNSLCY